ncbi:MAG: DNA polymerase III subunit beta [Rhodocyclaceae bacterium]
MLLIQCKRDDLLTPLQSVSGIIEKHHSLPILSNVLIAKSGEDLTLLSTDIEIQIKTRAHGKLGDQDVAVTTGARKLQDILRALPEASEVSVSIEDRKLTVKAGKSRFSLQTLPPEDYPRMAIPEGTPVVLELTQGTLKRLLSLVQYAMAQQDIRYYLNGLLFVVADDELRLVATDGHRLAYVREPLAQGAAPVEVILPRKTVQELNRLLGDGDEPVAISLAGNQAMFRFGTIELISKLIDGKFPDYERVVPRTTTKHFRLGRITLLKALQRAAIVSNEKLHGIHLALTSNNLRIASNNTEHEEGQEELDVEYSGDPIDIGFNVTYLLDVLSNVSADEVDCHMSDASSSALLTLPDNDRFKYVVMPMRV